MITKEKQFGEKTACIFPLTFGRARLNIGYTNSICFDDEW